MNGQDFQDGALANVIAEATSKLRSIAATRGVALPNDASTIPLVPGRAPTPPPYGIRTGTWSDAESFVREWARDGRRWVNIGIWVTTLGNVYFSYVTADRETGGDPNFVGRIPAINVNGPTFERDSHPSSIPDRPADW